MIPKIIHYCWFGRGDYSELTKKCIESWQKRMPDYEIKLWNEDTFDVNSVQYTKEAYEARKFAFVSDYVRLVALKQYGGIYFDTDVEALDSFDVLLNQNAFTYQEDEFYPSTGIIACEPENEVISVFLDYYNGRSFYNDIGYYDLNPNTVVFANVLKKYGYKPCQKLQNLEKITIYPKTSENQMGIDKFAIHYFEGSWTKETDDMQKIYNEEGRKYTKIFGERYGEVIHRNIVRIQKKGLSNWFSFVVNKLKNRK